MLIVGTPEERGLLQWRESVGLTANGAAHTSSLASSTQSPASKCYDLPFGMALVWRAVQVTRWIPLCPTFLASLPQRPDLVAGNTHPLADLKLYSQTPEPSAEKRGFLLKPLVQQDRSDIH